MHLNKHSKSYLNLLVTNIHHFMEKKKEKKKKKTTKNVKHLFSQTY